MGGSGTRERVARNGDGMSNGGIPLREWSGSGATEELHKTIHVFVEQGDRQAKAMIRLTWAVAILTVAMLGAVIVQIA